MTDRIALVLAIILVALIALDVYANDANALVFLGKKMIELIEYLSFWR